MRLVDGRCGAEVEKGFGERRRWLAIGDSCLTTVAVRSCHPKGRSVSGVAAARRLDADGSRRLPAVSGFAGSLLRRAFPDVSIIRAGPIFVSIRTSHPSGSRRDAAAGAADAVPASFTRHQKRIGARACSIDVQDVWLSAIKRGSNPIVAHADVAHRTTSRTGAGPIRPRELEGSAPIVGPAPADSTEDSIRVERLAGAKHVPPGAGELVRKCLLGEDPMRLVRLSLVERPRLGIIHDREVRGLGPRPGEVLISARVVAMSLELAVT